MYYGLSVPQYVEATGGCESCDLKATNKITESQTFYEFDNLEISITIHNQIVNLKLSR